MASITQSSARKKKQKFPEITKAALWEVAMLT